MKTPAPFLCAILFFSFFSFAYGQHRWSAEFRPNVNFPTTTFDRSDLTPGFGFEAAIEYQFMPRLGAYAGWGYNAFTPDDSDVDGIQPRDIDLTGYTFGLQFIHPIRGSSLSYLIRVGGIYSHIEVENEDGDVIADSGHGLGWEIGAGLQLDLGRKWYLRPQLGYRALSRDLEYGRITSDVDLKYISLGVGIAKGF